MTIPTNIAGIDRTINRPIIGKLTSGNATTKAPVPNKAMTTIVITGISIRLPKIANIIDNPVFIHISSIVVKFFHCYY